MSNSRWKMPETGVLKGYWPLCALKINILKRRKKVCRPTGNFIAHNHTRINIFILARSLTFVPMRLTGVSKTVYI